MLITQPHQLGTGRAEAPSTQTVLVAVVGTGSAGMHHVRALSALERVTPITVPIRSERIKELAGAGYATATTIHDAVQMGACLCVIATDPGRHVEDVVAATTHGLEVLVEKPMATDVPQARRVIEQAQRAKRRAFVGCVLRFSESLQTFRQWLPCVGRLHAVRVDCHSYLPEWRPGRPYRDSYSARAGEGGVLRDLIHEIDYAGWIFGWPKALQATVKNLGRLGIDSDELAELTWEAPVGCVVSIRLDYLTRPACRRIKACGERGTIEWDGGAQTVTLTAAESSARRAASAQTREELFRAQARAFIDACQGTRDARLATAEDGLHALAVCDAARRASASRREEPVEC